MSSAFNDEEPRIWTPGNALEFGIPDHVLAGGPAIAHNATFELAIWNEIMVPRYGWPRLRPEQCICTMAAAYAMALPGALDGACAALGLAEQKDPEGRRLMLLMAQPRYIRPDGTIVWWDDEERKARLYEYCKQDVRAERNLFARLVPLSKKMQRVWHLDYQINQRGIYVDRKSVKAAVEVARGEQESLNGQFFRVTEGKVASPAATAAMARWIGDFGISVDGVAKQDVVDILSQDGLPANVRSALLIRQEAAKTSTAKLYPMITAASADSRLRGMLQFHGASTGRWAGRRVQLHNMPRPKLDFEDIEHVVSMLNRAAPDEVREYMRLFYGSPLSVLADCLRSMLSAAPGKKLLAGDFANIEGRGLAWSAGEEWKLDAYRAYDAGIGPDLYLVAAGRIYHCSPDAVELHRQIGKVSELSLGYQGGVGAFQRMAPTHGVKVPDAQANEIKLEWRAAHPAVCAYWPQLENAAIDAALSPGSITAAGYPGRQAQFRMAGSFLWCRLPSGRALCYPYPQIEKKDTPWGEVKDALTYMGEDSLSRKWVRLSTYGGKLAENITQALCADLLMDALLRVDAAGLPIVLHVHDEIVVEVDENAKIDHTALCNLMAQSEPWAAGLPVVADGWTGKRYRK